MTKSPAANCLGSPLSAALHMASTPGAEVFEVLQKSDDKEEKKLRDQGR